MINSDAVGDWTRINRIAGRVSNSKGFLHASSNTVSQCLSDSLGVISTGISLTPSEVNQGT
ncbi:hypothetical protein ES707_09257 [subsurface metagenome]